MNQQYEKETVKLESKVWFVTHLIRVHCVRSSSVSAVSFDRAASPWPVIDSQPCSSRESMRERPERIFNKHIIFVTLN